MRCGVAVHEHLIHWREWDAATPADVTRAVVDLVRQHLDPVLVEQGHEGELVGAGWALALRFRRHRGLGIADGLGYVRHRASVHCGAMDLFARLEEEHALIESVASALDSFVHSSERAGSVNLHELIRFLTFLRGYADGLHHGREEAVLLPTLALSGFPLDSGALAHVRDQHREEARLMLDIAKAACAPEPWGPPQIARIATAARALTDFERSHMAEERQLLFPVARKELPAHSEALADAVARFESREFRYGGPWLEQLGRELVANHPSR
jgi:hemerythrin-like domain-containing protein